MVVGFNATFVASAATMVVSLAIFLVGAPKYRHWQGSSPLALAAARNSVVKLLPAWFTFIVFWTVYFAMDTLSLEQGIRLCRCYFWLHGTDSSILLQVESFHALLLSVLVFATVYPLVPVIHV